MTTLRTQQTEEDESLMRIRCSDVTKNSVSMVTKYTPPSCGQIMFYMRSKIYVPSTAMSRHSNRYSTIRFRMQATNTSTFNKTTTNNTNVACDPLSHKMAATLATESLGHNSGRLRKKEIKIWNIIAYSWADPEGERCTFRPASVGTACRQSDVFTYSER